MVLWNEGRKGFDDTSLLLLKGLGGWFINDLWLPSQALWDKAALWLRVHSLDKYLLNACCSQAKCSLAFRKQEDKSPVTEDRGGNSSSNNKIKAGAAGKADRGN